MNTSDTKALLDREKLDQFMNEHFSPYTGLLRELVDYGVHILAQCADKGGSTADLVVVGHFFRHSIAMLDGTEALLSRSAVTAAGTSARSLLEAYIFIAWILEKDTERRGRLFYIWQLRQQHEWARRTIPGTPEHTRFQGVLNKLSMMKDPIQKAAIEAEAIKQDAAFTKTLNISNNKLINDEFDKLKKRHFDVPWYRPDGPNSIGQITKDLKLDSEYAFFYSEFSDITHVGSFNKSVKVKSTGVEFEPIRSPERIDSMISIVGTLAIRIYRLILKKYLPNEYDNFNTNYIKQWRQRYLSIPKVNITETPKDTQHEA